MPGTTIELPQSIRSIRTLSSSLFLGGGLTLAQVSSLTNIPPHVLQNWVKRGFVSTPPKKRYTQNQFFRIAIFNILKDHMRMELIAKLIKYVNMNLPEDSTDLIDETTLYNYFVEALFLADNYYVDKLDAIINIALKSFREPYQGASKRLAIVIRIMVILYISSQIKNSADLLLRNIGLL
jgi:DNA-binding transcriptional MerR regulator